MYQHGRRAGALDVDLMSNQPEERRCDRLCSGVVLEKRWKMFESRAAQVGIIFLLSTGEARGINSLMLVCWICVMYVAISGVLYIYFEL